MRNNLFFLIVLILFTGCTTKLSKEQNAKLFKIYNERNYFKLDNLMSRIEDKNNDPDWQLYKSKLDYVFNRSEESNFLINRLLKKKSGYFNDTTIADLHYMLAYNADRIQDYALATKEGELLISKYQHLYDSSFVSVLKDDLNIWKMLIGIPKMETKINFETQISLKKDIAGLLNIPVINNNDNDTTDFVFDTGANISVIVKSLATKLGATILKNKIYVYAFTGNRFESELGIASFKLGNIEIKNSVFLVFPDSLLSFVNGAYKIKGVIGFPVMNALKEFTLKENKVLIIPQIPEEKKFRNMALDDATPVIMVNYANDTLPFHFDTGADRTILYSNFYNKYKDKIAESSKIKNKIGGAGGAIDAETYILDSAMIYAGNSNCQIYGLQILTKQLGDEQKYLYGNFGQDYIKNFSEMTINFASMNISFTGIKK
jgi:hypothetical protein